MQFDSLISCHPKDFVTLNLCVNGIKENAIGVRNIYIVSKINPQINNTTWISEDIFPFKIQDIKNYIYPGREGWYFAQLIKLYTALLHEDMLENVLIVDADTIFLNPTSFEEDGKLCYNYGTEYHLPYFIHMKYLHPDFVKILPVSGICHHLLVEKKKIREIFELVEKFHGKGFWKVFLEKTIVDSPVAQESGAAEYEIYFHYIFRLYPNNYHLRELKWKNSGSLHEVELDKKQGFHYVSYHSYMRGF
jgi:hypothetical protein